MNGHTFHDSLSHELILKARIECLFIERKEKLEFDERKRTESTFVSLVF